MNQQELPNDDETSYQASYKEALVTYILIGINVVLFLLFSLQGNMENVEYAMKRGAAYPSNILENGEYWRLLTSNFYHFNIKHLLNNMIILAAAGIPVEREVGHLKYALLYLLSGIGGSLVSILWMVHAGDYYVSGGASGAIMGMVGGLLAIVLMHKGKFRDIKLLPLIFMVLIIVESGLGTQGIDNAGHIGGFVTGFVLEIILYLVP